MPKVAGLLLAQILLAQILLAQILLAQILLAPPNYPTKRFVYKPPCGPNPQGGLLKTTKPAFPAGFCFSHPDARATALRHLTCE